MTAPQQQTLLDPISPGIDSQIRDYVEKRRRHDRINEELKAAKKELDQSKESLWDYLEAEGTKTIHHVLGRITRSAPRKAYVKDFDAFMTWLRDHDLVPALTKLAVRQAEVNAYVSEALDKGDDVPDGVEPFTYKQINFYPAASTAAPQAVEQEN